MKLFHLGGCLGLVLLWGCSSGSPLSPGLGNTPEHQVQEGMASWYGKRYHGRQTASGAPFNMNAMTAAHRKLPFGTRVRVTRKDTGKSVIVTINDRGPFAKGRIIDISKKAATRLGILKRGEAKVSIEVLP